MAVVIALIIVVAGMLVRVTRSGDASPSTTVGSTTPSTTIPTPVPTVAEVTTTTAPGPAKVEVPSVIGLDRNAAEDRVRAAGLEPTVGVIALPDRPEGFVVSQTPLPAELVRKGTTVALVVSAAR